MYNAEADAGTKKEKKKKAAIRRHHEQEMMKQKNKRTKNKKLRKKTTEKNAKCLDIQRMPNTLPYVAHTRALGTYLTF